jgi:LysM repeat protein
MSFLRWILPAALTLASASAQGPASAIDVANLKEDVRGLTQKLNEVSLRLEQLERENANLRTQIAATGDTKVTLSQLNQALGELKQTVQAAATSQRTEILQTVAGQLEKLANQTNAALDALAKNQATRPAVQIAFSDNFPKEGVSYTVQKGDTFDEIIKKTGARRQDVINANKLADPSRIQVGQTLFIPSPPVPAAK